jgi:hypothetical protein
LDQILQGSRFQDVHNGLLDLGPELSCNTVSGPNTITFVLDAFDSDSGGALKGAEDFAKFNLIWRLGKYIAAFGASYAPYESG